MLVGKPLLFFIIVIVCCYCCYYSCLGEDPPLRGVLAEEEAEHVVLADEHEEDVDALAHVQDVSHVPARDV